MRLAFGQQFQAPKVSFWDLPFQPNFVIGSHDAGEDWGGR